MIDPELAAMVEMLPKIDLADPVAARRAFEEILVAIRIDIPGVETLDIEDRMVPGLGGRPGRAGARLPARRARRPRRRGARHRDDPRRRLRHRQRRGRARRRGHHGHRHRRRRRVGRLPPGARAPLPGRVARLLRRAVATCTPRRMRWAWTPTRVALAGASAGGGLAAATALLARDRGGPPVCFQLLQIPELDDRLETPSMQTFVDSPLWNRPLAVQSWQAYLGPLYGSDRRAGVRGAGPGDGPRRGCRPPTSRPPRTIRCATRGSPTPSACCRPGCRWSCTSSPAPSTARRW